MKKCIIFLLATGLAVLAKAATLTTLLNNGSTKDHIIESCVNG